MYGPFRYQLRWPWQCVPLDYPAPTFISNYRRNDSVSNDDLNSLSSTIALIFSPGGRRWLADVLDGLQATSAHLHP